MMDGFGMFWGDSHLSSETRCRTTRRRQSARGPCNLNSLLQSAPTQRPAGKVFITGPSLFSTHPLICRFWCGAPSPFFYDFGHKHSNKRDSRTQGCHWTRPEWLFYFYFIFIFLITSSFAEWIHLLFWHHVLSILASLQNWWYLIVNNFIQALKWLTVLKAIKVNKQNHYKNQSATHYWLVQFQLLDIGSSFVYFY